VNLGGPEGGKIEWSFTWADATPPLVKAAAPAAGLGETSSAPEPPPAADDAQEASADEVSIVWSAC
jgi:hypothetical protein